MRTKMRTLCRGGLLAAAALPAARLRARECPAFHPGPEHEILAAAAGDFDLAFSDGGTGTSSCALGLGGRWLLEHVQAEFCGRPYEGRGATSYDQARRKYVNVWIDSVSPAPLVSEGSYDAATRTLTLVGDMTTPDGKTVQATLVHVYGDAGRRTFALKVPGPDDKDAEVFRDDPDAVVRRAVEAGATAGRGVREHRMPRGVHRQGGCVDPFGRIWFAGDRSPLRPRARRLRAAGGGDEGRAPEGRDP